jgi:hypothetical protein
MPVVSSWDSKQRRRFRQETLAARHMIARVKERFGICAEGVGADKAHGSGEFLAWLLERRIQPYIPVIDRRHQTHRHFTRDQFQYDQVNNVFRCPQGQTLRYCGMDRQAQGYLYQTAESQCRGCPVKKRCTGGSTRRIFVHWHEPARQTPGSWRKLPRMPARNANGTRSRLCSPNSSCVWDCVAYVCGGCGMSLSSSTWRLQPKILSG